MIYFVTPAWKRYALSEVCFAQRALVCAEIGARCVVIANDQNLDLARSFGFDVLERSNRYLGKRFNDGIAHAAKQGADWIVPIGSDSWIDPAYFADLVPGITRTSRLYAVVEAERMALARVGTKAGAGPFVLGRETVRAVRYRPAGELLRRHIDSSMVRSLLGAKWQHHDLHPYQYIGFRGHPTITPYERIRDRWGYREEDWAGLAEHYPADLVDRARAALDVRA